MRTLDFSPLLRNSVGFERLQRLLDEQTRASATNNTYPPYNIVQTGEDGYRISIALAGFSEQDLDVTAKENTLVVSATVNEGEGDKTYLHHGIAGRAFERRFDLADHIKVVNASLVNGLLNIDLMREIPEEKKPRKIAIETKPSIGDQQKAA
ncbi:MAG: Hsp20 family protein [Nitrospinaceae bacterium]|jgi:molecular chaperone IbpA|nr:Hsp20 family protein [Alphaproteobacteria bacterium]MBT7857863.1 Hsp20 family protein [Nitrospinaceae bacterium]